MAQLGKKLVNKIRNLPLLAIMMLFVIALCILVAIEVHTQSQQTEIQCQALCEGLKHQKVTVTRDACICEDPETNKRQAYPRSGSWR